MYLCILNKVLTMDNYKQILKQLSTCVFSKDRRNNFLINRNKFMNINNIPEDFYYYNGDGVFCCTMDLNSWSYDNKKHYIAFNITEV